MIYGQLNGGKNSVANVPAGVSSDIAELCLGHVLPGIRATYDRHSYWTRRQRRSRLWQS